MVPSLAMVPSQVYAQDNTANDPLESEQVSPTAPETAPELVVIGTRRTDRSVTDSASPIDVIGATELGAQPAANMLATVRNLLPSFFVPQNTIPTRRLLCDHPRCVASVPTRFS